MIKSSRRSMLGAFALLPWTAPAQAKSADALAQNSDESRLFVHMSGSAIPAHVTIVRTDGYSVPGRGAAAYALAPSGKLGPDRFQVADGRWFALAERLPDTFMFGGVGNGTHDDTAAIQAQHDYCLAHHLPVVLPVPPDRWRTTDTIHSRVSAWRGLGSRIPWKFEPSSPEEQDMRACLELETTAIVESIEFEGPHLYDPRRPTTYVSDATQGPHQPDGGWYHGFFKPGCCAIRVSGLSQPILRDVGTSGRGPSFKVGVCIESLNGHVQIGPGCSFYDLIGIRVVKNSDDLKLLGEPVITSGLIGILFGTSNLNGTFNGGLGLRTAEVYIGSCAYGVLQMHDHGPKGSPLPNPHLPIEGLYGTLDGSFLEAIGEAGVQTLPTAICRDLTYADMARFSWSDDFKLPDALLPAGRKQRAAFAFGQLSRNCRFGTLRSQPSYKSPFTKTADACSLRFELLDADASTVIAQPLLASTLFVRTSPGARVSDKPGRVLHEGDLRIHAAFATQGNLLRDPHDPGSWQGNRPRLSSPTSLPVAMEAELGRQARLLTLSGPGTYSLGVRDAPNELLARALTYLSLWANIPAGARMLVRLRVQDTRDPYRYAVTLQESGGWQQVMLGGNAELGAAGTALDLVVEQGVVELAGPMLSVDQMRPFTSLDGPGTFDRLHALGGLAIRGELAIETGSSARLPAGASPPSSTPQGYLAITINGVLRHLPYY